jgi:cardiolipin synthase
VDGSVGFVSGVCVSAAWLGNPARGRDPWRDTGIALHGPALADHERAFAETWATLGEPLPADALSDPATIAPAGDVALRVIATQPASAGTYRMDQLVAALAHQRLWLTDAYFVGAATYVSALTHAARDGVDVRLLVPGASDIPVVAALSRTGYRALLESGIRVFEWNGPMLHAKTAVADDRWARVGSTNLNLASWLGNCEIDVAIENTAFVQQMADQYEQDLHHATEIVLSQRHRARPATPHPHHRLRDHGSAGRSAVGALRMATTLGAALGNRRVLSNAETRPLLGGTALLLALAAIAAWWPRVVAWPLGAFALWIAVSLAALTQTPDTKPTLPSTVRSFRWSRLIQPNGLKGSKGLKVRTLPPASSRGCQKRARGPAPCCRCPDESRAARFRAQTLHSAPRRRRP